MKTYKVLRAWEGVKVGEELKEGKHGELNYAMKGTDPISVIAMGWNMPPHVISMLLHLGFIEEVGAVKKERFVPKTNEKYWFVSNNGTIIETVNMDDYFGGYEGRIKIHNCYRTEAEALEARERVLKAY